MYLLDNSDLGLLYGIDNWMGNKTGKNRHVTLDKLAHYGDRYKFIQMDSAEAANLFEDESLDYVYIDGDHSYEGAKKDLIAWYPKVKKGGFFGGHDYIKTRQCNVIPAVDEFFASINREFNLTAEANKNQQNKSFWIIK